MVNFSKMACLSTKISCKEIVIAQDSPMRKLPKLCGQIDVLL